MSIDFALEHPVLVHGDPDDGVVADRVRSELGTVTRLLDTPHPHVSVCEGIVALHGDVRDLAAGAAIEAHVLGVAGVRGVRSHLHVGLLRSDTTPSQAHRRQTSELLRTLRRTVAGMGFASRTETDYAISAVLSVFSWRLPASVRIRYLKHLPYDVRRLAQPPRWLADAPRAVAREHDFAQTVALVAGCDRELADRLTRQILPVISEQAASERMSIARVLPTQLRAIWVNHPCVTGGLCRSRRPQSG